MHPSATARAIGRTLVVLGMVAALLIVSGCGKNPAEAASDSDANGYLCTKCGAKFFTSRSVFLAATCPTCKADSLVEVVGYVCEKDDHLTLKGRTDDRNGASVCEKCGAPLGGMRLPRAKDLKAWGAIPNPN
jgi:hypothetical protein